MTFLSRTTRLMEAPLSVEERLQQLADLAVSEIADWCAVHLVRGNRVDQVAVAHSDPAKVAFVARLAGALPARPGRARRGDPGEPHRRARLLPRDPRRAAHRRRGRRRAPRPHPVHRDALGAGRAAGRARAGSWARSPSCRPSPSGASTSADLAFAEQLATTAAVALDNARLYEEQWRTAHTLQAALLPADLPAVPGLRLAARYRAADRRRAEDARRRRPLRRRAGRRTGAGVVVADVCGKGAEAAALTALIRHTVRAEIDHGLGPAEVLERLNRAMLRASGGRPGRFATVAQARLTRTPTGATVRLASAGHPPPLRASAAAGPSPCRAPGTLLGVYPDVTLTEVTFDLHHGEIMVLYTDGVTEARGADGLYGPERLARAVAAARGHADDVADRLLADVDAFQHGRQRDDIAILVIEAMPRTGRDRHDRRGRPTGELDISTYEDAPAQLADGRARRARRCWWSTWPGCGSSTPPACGSSCRPTSGRRQAGRRLALRLGDGPARRVFAALGLVDRFEVLD